MTPAVLDILAREFGLARGAAKRQGKPTSEELTAAATAGYPTDVVEGWTHDMVVAHLHMVRERLAAETITGAFIAGVGGSSPRGLQPLISYAFARHLPAHAATGTRHLCETCAILKAAKVDRTARLVRCHLGFLWNELPTEWVVDLEELAMIGPPQPTDADHATFRALLEAIAEAPVECTPGQLEKELARRKVLPHTRDKYQRYGILEALAEVGVLPNPLIPPSWDRFVPLDERLSASSHLKGNARSDIVLPFGAWRGALGVDWTRAEALFGVRRGEAPPTGAGTSRGRRASTGRRARAGAAGRDAPGARRGPAPGPRRG